MVKRITLLGTMLFLLLSSFANDKKYEDAALKFIKDNYTSFNLTKDDLSNLKLTSSTYDDYSDIHRVWFQQSINGIGLKNGYLSVHYKDNKVVNFNSNSEQSFSTKVQTTVPVLSANNAAAIAINHIVPGLAMPALVSDRKDASIHAEYFKPITQLSEGEIATYLILTRDKKNKVYLAYDIQFSSNNKFENIWSVEVDALTGQIINEKDMVLHCSFGHSGDSGNGSSANNILGQNNTADNILDPMAGSYRVYPYTIEAPIYGSRTLISNPDNATASPYGWHDTNGAAGAEYTTTRGNNVYAYEDKDNNNNADAGSSPDGTASLTFDFPLDFSTQLDTLTNAKACVTQLFYMNNIMHDIFYQYGFTESNRNFQTKNYSGVPYANDFVNAEAHDGGGLNNANFFTSADGQNNILYRSRMQMYMWSGATPPTLTALAPSSIAGDYLCGYQASWGPPCQFSVTGSLAIATSSTTPPNYVCGTVNSDVSGKIALIDRGDCQFSEKVYNVQQAGAIGAIIINRQSAGDSLISMSAGTNAALVTIPAVFVTYATGQILKNNMPSTVVKLERISSNNCLEFDGSLDNGVVSHEYGHGISTRLTGPLNTTSPPSCLSNEEQAGEGWSDFFALALTKKPTDTKNTARGIGNYVIGEGVSGEGIRRVPYSYDMSIDPLTYGDVALDPEVHNIGEIWCSALWDMYWLLVEAYGYNTDLYNGTGGNNRAIKLVIEGLKQQPCNPGFLDSRNAILKADSILYGYADKCLIWQAFARRGMGWSASQGSSADATDQTEAFDLPSACNLTPTASFTLTDTIICQNSSITFTNTSTGSPDSVRWTINGGTPNTSTSATTVSSTFNTSGSYTVSLTIYKSGTAYGPYTKTITVKLKPTVTATTPNTTICSGNAAVLTGGGATTYSWNTGATTNTISVSPTTTTTYTVTGSTNGCSNTATLTLNVNTTPTVTATPSASSICSGTSVTITGGGATTYSWNTGATTNAISVSPTTTTTYTVTGTSNGCPNTATTTISVNTTPTVTATPSASAICSGTSVTITGGGATTYSWNTGATGGTLSVSPTTTTTYTVTGTSNGCSSTASTTINVTARPTVTATPTASSICSGNSVTINGGGATTYSWNTGATSSSISVSPTTTTTYTVTGTANGCTNTATTTINVNQTPTVNVNNPSICAGASTTLTATGATTYSWNTGATTASISVSPTTTTTYTVTGTANGCTRTVNATVTVNTTAPTVTLNSTTPSICQGESITLTANGADNYSWNTGATSNSITVTPSTTTTYTVNGTLSGCSTAGTATATVNVKPKPTVVVNSTSICTGESATITGSGATTYSWNTGATTAGITVSPTTTTTYTVTGTTNGCSNTATSTITVKSLPTVTVNNPTICAGSSATLTAAGAANYSWNTGATTNAITVSPTTTTTYTVTGTGSNGCARTVNATVNVNSTTPTVTLNNTTVSVCNGTGVTLTASGADNYTWSTGATGSSITFTPTTNGTVSVNGTLAGCSTPGTATASITVKPNPTVGINNASGSICAGSSATLGGTGADTYVWNTGATTNSISVSPTTTTTYSVTGTTNGCIGTASTTVVVNALPSTAIGTSAASICSGQSATLTGSGADTYAWNTGATSTSISVSPTTTTTYTLTGTSNGCSKTATQTISVNATPAQATITQNTGRDTLYCSTVVAGATYNWYLNGSTTPIVTGTPWIKITQSGSYTVEVISSGCTSALSSAFAGIYTAIRVNSNTIRAWEVYPNPTDGRLLLNLSLVKQAEVSISIYNAVGSEVYVKSYGNVKDINDEVRLDNLAKGVYIIKMNVENETFYHKVVKN